MVPNVADSNLTSGWLAFLSWRPHEMKLNLLILVRTGMVMPVEQRLRPDVMGRDNGKKKNVSLNYLISYIVI